ncbi:hypothetical protein GCM10025881_04330 [Pseudolysinimonas kribbensis]|uniref:Ig-like domain-containing protein n=2 Tax=Pseudolysinimonas kribbensis TaxID=433641 RepID=A0ABQ6K2F3_9MICO|nr:hypothetical protein GCM10025881_04330 [Pseudolysinimonas kribbensis]
MPALDIRIGNARRRRASTIAYATGTRVLTTSQSETSQYRCGASGTIQGAPTAGSTPKYHAARAPCATPTPARRTTAARRPRRSPRAPISRSTSGRTDTTVCVTPCSGSRVSSPTQSGAMWPAAQPGPATRGVIPVRAMPSGESTP